MAGSYYEELAAKKGIRIPLDAQLARRAQTPVSYSGRQRDSSFSKDPLTGKKLCPDCGRTEDEVEFSPDVKRKDGLSLYCKDCKSKRSMRSQKHSRFKEE